MAILAGDHPSESVKVRHSTLRYSDHLTNNISHNLEWRKIGGKLVLITNRKSYMSFRFLTQSVTLNDLEQHNGRCVAFFH